MELNSYKTLPWILPILFAAPAHADSRGPLPMVALDGQVGVDSASGDTTNYRPTTGAGVGIRGGFSLLGLVKGPRSSPGFFIRDHLTVELLIGAGGEGLHGRAFAGAGLRIGTMNERSAYYLAPRAYTGFNNSRARFGAGTGAGRAAWVIGVGAAFAGGGFEVGYGKGSDTRDTAHTVFDVELSRRVGKTMPTVMFVHYQGLYGGDTITEHNLSAGVGMRM